MFQETIAPVGKRTMILNMGPQHPSTHGVLHLILELDGETILKATADIGFLHTGIEKTCEAKTYHQAITLTERIDYLCPLTNNLCYVLAVEKLLGLEPPSRAQWMRVMLNELTRIGSHLVWLGTHANDIGATTVLLYCFREREEILNLFEAVSGQRMMTSYFRVGGLALEPPAGFLKRVEKVMATFPDHIDEYEELLTRNRIWMARTKSVGILTKEDALDFAVSGPTARASGIDWDLRRDNPYSSYDKFSFRVPLRAEGDIYARYIVRMEEMRESLKIVRQALEGMPEGPIQVNAPAVVLPQGDNRKTEMEALIQQFKIVIDGFCVPPGEVYQAVESPRGEMGYYIVSDGTAHPYRVKVRSPSFANLQALPRLAEGRLLSDLVACIGSIDIVLGEIDR
ncbi:MAG: NADH dehydrogenase [Acidobacteria bacterium RIFCSPLOWO2_12_FULL_54_10]|nr:MAG: NADH dehydrogenase [Acidobacteria bacterium RIFCSPLOWO2_12_FULL_54_10]